MEDLISVIVPVYNVETYVSECIESIINQTYDNLEIILVDDGSTDNSGEICDLYACKDSRIKVVHKLNGGLSDARNAGIAIANGQYIGFVDSDDYIELNMYEELYSNMKKNGVALGCARYDLVGEKCDYSLPIPTNEIKVLPFEKMLEIIFLGLLGQKDFASISVWDRLYRRDIIEGLFFPKGECYEDIVYSTNAVINAKQCVYVNKALYHYRIRKGSITDYTEKLDERLISQKLKHEKQQMELLEKNNLIKSKNTVKINAFQDLVYYRCNYICGDFEKTIDSEIKLLRPKISEISNSSFSKSEKIKCVVKAKCIWFFKWYLKKRK